MALNLANTVVNFYSKIQSKKFTAREIANWIFEIYPDECRQKQIRSTATVNPLDNETALLQQIVAEIGSQRPRLQKRHPEVKTTARSKNGLFQRFQMEQSQHCNQSLMTGLPVITDCEISEFICSLKGTELALL